MESVSSTPAQAKPRKFFWLLVCIAILAAGFISMSLLRAFAPQPKQISTPLVVPQVETITLEYRDSPLKIKGQGLVIPRAEIGISAQVNGDVISISPQLKSGGRFKASEVLLQIDARLYQAAVDEAQSALVAQKSAFELLERQLARAVPLKAREFVDENTIDDLRSRRDQAAANLKRQESILLNRELDLEHTSIKAPFNGYLLSKSVDVGDVVAPGRELARFYASDSAEIVVALNVNDAAFIPNLWTANTSKRAAVVRAEYGGREFEWSAVVDRVESDLDRNTRTVDVVVSVPDLAQLGRPVGAANGSIGVEPPPLLVGMFADVIIDGRNIPKHFVLPVSAVHDNKIWIVEGGQTLRVVEVERLRQEGDRFVLLAPNLSEGALIVTSNLALVSDGMQVTVAGAAL